MRFIREDFSKGYTVEEVTRLAKEWKDKALGAPARPPRTDGEVERPHAHAKVCVTSDGKPGLQALQAHLGEILVNPDDVFLQTGGWHSHKAGLTQNNRLFADIVLVAFLKAYGRDTSGRVNLSLTQIYLPLP